MSGGSRHRPDYVVSEGMKKEEEEKNEHFCLCPIISFRFLYSTAENNYIYIYIYLTKIMMSLVFPVASIAHTSPTIVFFFLCSLVAGNEKKTRKKQNFETR